VAVEITIRQAQAERAFSEGDRIQFIAPNRDQHVANRELGTIEKVDEIGNLRIRLDSGRAIAFQMRILPNEYRIDFGPGYRIYFGKEGDLLVILVGGGTKKRQQEDIRTALDRWEDYKQRKGTGR
jgi:hypothetical protein